MRRAQGLALCLSVGGCTRGQPDGAAVAAPSAVAPVPSAIASAAPSATASAAPPATPPDAKASDVQEAPGSTPQTASPSCPSTLRVEKGDSFESITNRCYGSRTYQDLLVSHNHHERKGLRAGETLKIPPFETLAREHVAAKWASEMSAVAASYAHFRRAEPEIDRQLRSQKPGMGPYRPTAAAKLELDAAASALRPVVEHLRAAGVRTKKFAQAVQAFEQLASGEGSFSTDYATEDIHQCFSYGISALE
ncbi:hypothetical protein [Polyangium fumosum]|uniref:LysM domain-containing protein n=1 Tax=Polyangium fumosum TaxID=889272 RepID=A0A4U1J1S1_9BACT|nr:hypothetical protein [Polyangium fumosum]TKD01034.1 hypothetical protein E8A74_32220 [Polyangium fumosum]